MTTRCGNSLVRAEKSAWLFLDCRRLPDSPALARAAQTRRRTTQDCGAPVHVLL